MIEEEFFKTFGIEPIAYSRCTSDYCISADKPYPTICKKCHYYTVYKIGYPPITNRILLELICILNSTNGINCTAYESKNIKDLKNEILNECIEIADDKELKTKVHKLFESEEE